VPDIDSNFNISLYTCRNTYANTNTDIYSHLHTHRNCHVHTHLDEYTYCDSYSNTDIHCYTLGPRYILGWIDTESAGKVSARSRFI
jgi:hypothetical protein